MIEDDAGIETEPEVVEECGAKVGHAARVLEVVPDARLGTVGGSGAEHLGNVGAQQTETG